MAKRTRTQVSSVDVIRQSVSFPELVALRDSMNSQVNVIEHRATINRREYQILTLLAPNVTQHRISDGMYQSDSWTFDLVDALNEKVASGFIR